MDTLRRFARLAQPEHLPVLDEHVAAGLGELSSPPVALQAAELLAACHAALHGGELQLLQAHISACLGRPLDPSSPPSISQLLMADWVCLAVRHPELRDDELLPVAAAVYAAAGT